MDMDTKLIKEVREFPVLYDPNHNDYKNSTEKNLAWKEIALRLELSEKNCRRRWKGLRDAYGRWKKTMEISKKLGTKPPRRRLRYSEEMAFLDINRKKKIDVSLEDCEELISIEKIDSVSPAMPDLEQIYEPEEEKEYGEGSFENIFDRISELGTMTIQRSQTNSTALHFASLAAQIREANLPSSISNQIEAQVAALVFSEIAKYQDFLCAGNECKYKGLKQSYS